MTTKVFLIITVAFLWAISADGKEVLVSFLKVGKSYTILSSDPRDIDFGEGQTVVTITEVGGGQWFRVRYNGRRKQIDNEYKYVELTPWLNFAHMRMIFEAKDENSASPRN